MDKYFETRDGLMKVTDEFKRAVSESRVLTLKELESMSDSKFKIGCKKVWNFVRKGIEFDIRVIKALKYSITR